MWILPKGRGWKRQADHFMTWITPKRLTLREFLKVKDVSLIRQILLSLWVLLRLGKTPSKFSENKQWNSQASVQVCVVEKVLPSNSTLLKKKAPVRALRILGALRMQRILQLHT